MEYKLSLLGSLFLIGGSIFRVDSVDALSNDVHLREVETGEVTLVTLRECEEASLGVLAP